MIGAIIASNALYSVTTVIKRKLRCRVRFRTVLMHLSRVTEEHGILAKNGRMFSVHHFHFQLKYVNILTMPASKLKMCVYV